jgi:hypothetical protein
MYTETKNNKKLKVGIFYRIFFFLSPAWVK